MMQAIYKSAMEEDLGKSFQIKKQDELIDKDGNFEQRSNQKTTSTSNPQNNNPSGQEQIAKASSSTEISSSQKNDNLTNLMRRSVRETKKSKKYQQDLQAKRRIAISNTRKPKKKELEQRKRYHNFIVWDEGFWYEGSTYYSVNKEGGFGVLLKNQDHRLR
ncbi:hypothetical protein RhiirC2_814753 [Rhizophagus irregularis]|uniref:Uncharacterized protein n=1 Tax=Rhizophagus irregularis TaxID=588596 RepID=A0A2N1MLE2_9GLOM|nr:hypothetical protein RhiirC2_814753 [Rhizophagus irregularis]